MGPCKKAAKRKGGRDLIQAIFQLESFARSLAFNWRLLRRQHFDFRLGNRGIMSVLSDWGLALLSPSPVALLIATLLVLSIPLFLHSFVFRASGLTTLPSILLLGPSGSGKTALLTLVRMLTSKTACINTNRSSSSAAPPHRKLTRPKPPSPPNATSQSAQPHPQINTAP